MVIYEETLDKTRNRYNILEDGDVFRFFTNGCCEGSYMMRMFGGHVSLDSGARQWCSEDEDSDKYVVIFDAELTIKRTLR
jgi:hypothetical protein